MDGFKNTTKMKYMCGGPVKKATGGVMKSAAPKGLLKTAAGAKIADRAVALAKKAAPEIAPKRQVQPTPPKDVVREAPRPTMEPKRLIAQTPPDDVKTIGGAPKAPKATSSPQWKQSDEDAVTRYAKATSVEDGKKFRVALGKAQQAKTGTPPKDAGREAARPTMAPKPAKAIPSVGAAKKGVPVASNKPMIGLKGGGHVTKSMSKW